MYEKELNQLIKLAPNVSTIRIYNMLINMEQFKGGVIVSRRYVAEELNLSIPYTYKIFDWLIKAEFIKETKINGYTQIILNKFDESDNKTEEKVEQPQKNSQPKPTVIRKGGKTITRYEIPD